MTTEPVTVASLKKVAEGREAEMFAWDKGRLLRLLRNPEHARSMQYEVAGAKAAEAGGVRVPAMYETLSVDGRPGIVVERIRGKDLLVEMAAKPWQIWTIGAECGRLHAQVNRVLATGDIPDLRVRLADQIRRSDQVPAKYAEYAFRELGRLPDGDRLCHGDFHPGNVMRARNELVVIDWPNSMRGDYHADFARTTLMLRLGDPPPSAPWLIRFGAKFARILLKSAYQRGYRGAMKVNPTLHRRWETVRAVHRLGDGIESERRKILRLLAERLDAT